MKLPGRLRRLMVANMLALPGMTVNYSVLVLLIDVIHFNGFWVLSGVLVCDIIGLGFNGYMVDFSTRIAMRFESFWELVDKQEVKRLVKEKGIIDNEIDRFFGESEDDSVEILKSRIHVALDENLRPKKKVPIHAYV